MHEGKQADCRIIAGGKREYYRKKEELA